MTLKTVIQGAWGFLKYIRDKRLLEEMTDEWEDEQRNILLEVRKGKKMDCILPYSLQKGMQPY